jgi:hypothetical protein
MFNPKTTAAKQVEFETIAATKVESETNRRQESTMRNYLPS